MANPQQFMTRLALLGSCLALIVVAMGAYTRLTHAGLGCPDWPGCYGHMIVDQTAVVASKAWTEMIHRYLAGSLVIVIASLCFGTLRDRVLRNKAGFLPWGLALLVIAQAALGMWTVTWRLLPIVVMSHLLGGVLLLSGLWLLYLNIRRRKTPFVAVRQDPRFKMWALLGVVLVLCQIALGGWTSTNYAALICPDFPMCRGQWLPPLDFYHAFQLWPATGINSGVNYEGGVLNEVARTTIHLCHRIGAAVVFIYIVTLSLFLRFKARSYWLRQMALWLLLVVSVQVTLGILNVLWLLPLVVAVLHTIVASLLLLSLVTLSHYVFQPDPNAFSVG